VLKPLYPVILSILLALNAAPGWPQAAAKGPAPGGSTAGEQGVHLAESGRCADALPLLKKSIRQIAGRDLRKRAGLDGLRCAMMSNVSYEALVFLDVLTHEFPRDPEVLYVVTHAFSDLSLRASQSLMREAPFSYQVRELNAEALEVQGQWDKAAADYRKILDVNPLLPGIHARLGRALLSKPQHSSTDIEEAKKNFEEELQIDPKNAAAEYVLGELAKDDGDLSAAIGHYTRATKIDAGFAEAYLGLGAALVANKQFAEAIPPLEAYEKLAPDSPSGHYQLALAYNGVGRKEDANREAALQRETAASLEQLKRKIAEGLLQQSPSPPGQPPKPPQ
jgi:tetratricopeptide (TPR) repeat protein